MSDLEPLQEGLGFLMYSMYVHMYVLNMNPFNIKQPARPHLSPHLPTHTSLLTCPPTHLSSLARPHISPHLPAHTSLLTCPPTHLSSLARPHISPHLPAHTSLLHPPLLTPSILVTHLKRLDCNAFVMSSHSWYNNRHFARSFESQYVGFLTKKRNTLSSFQFHFKLELGPLT